MTLEFNTTVDRSPRASVVTCEIWTVNQDGCREYIGEINEKGIYSSGWRVELKDGRVANAPTLSKAKLAARLLLGATGQVTV